MVFYGKTINILEKELTKMQHFAQLDDNNIVINVMNVDDNECKTANETVLEEIGIGFCKKLLGPNTKWKQTCRYQSIRRRFARLGDTYDETLDAFIAPKPYSSWIFNEEIWNWESPIGNPPELTPEQALLPSEDRNFIWDEEAYQKDNTTGWVLPKI